MSDSREYYRQKYKELKDLPGVGPATITKLKEVGIRTIEGVGSSTPNELIKAGVGEETAHKMISEARKAFAVEFVKGTEIAEMIEKRLTLTTGCTSLDRLMTQLNGKVGVPTQSITELYGEFGSGKSQMCHQLCVTAQLPVEEGGFDGAALYIDTEEVFTPSRVVQIAERFPSIDPDTVLDNVVVARAYTSQHQIALLNSAEEVIKEEGIKLIILDSLTSHFRSEYLGRAMLASRQQTLNAHMHRLIRYAKAFDAAAVVTNQVSSTPDQYGGFEPIPIGGNIVGHIAHTRIFIRKARNLNRIFKIIASPFLAEGEAPAMLNELGLVSEEDMPPKEEEEE